MQVYCAAKAGLAHFVRSAAEPLQQKNIRLVGLCPGLISTTLVGCLLCMLTCGQHIRTPMFYHIAMRPDAWDAIPEQASDCSRVYLNCRYPEMKSCIAMLVLLQLALPENTAYRLFAEAWRITKFRRPAQSIWRKFQVPCAMSLCKASINRIVLCTLKFGDHGAKSAAKVRCCCAKCSKYILPGCAMQCTKHQIYQKICPAPS